MSGRGRKTGKLKKARDDVAERDMHIAEMAQAHRRLEHLYDISKALTRFQSVDRTVPEVIALVAQTLPLRSAILIVETDGTPRTIVWQAPGERSGSLEAAKTHARANYGYLVRSGVTFERNGKHVVRLPEQLATDTGLSKNGFVILPLAVDRGSIFGALQVESAREVTEPDLIFFSALVNQLSIAMDRHAAITARQESIETSEKDQRLLAELSAALGASLEYGSTLAELAQFAVPRIADVCLVDQLSEDGKVQRVLVRFADESKQRNLAGRVKRFAPAPGWQTPDAKVIASGRSFLISTVADPLAEGIAHDEEHAEVIRSAGIRSIMALPLVARGRTLGALVLAAAESGRQYSTHDLAIAEEIARRAAIAIDNARLYEVARRATVARDNLLAVVSHDLRNPLAVILMSVDALLTPPPREERRGSRRQLETVQRSAHRMTRMVEDLLATASIEAGQLSIEQRRLDLTPVISEAIDALSAVAGSKSLHLVRELPAELPAVYADGPRVQQVLANLLGNAIKFTPDGGTIIVHAESSGEHVLLSVSDTGPGIAHDELPHLFDRFWQAERTARLGSGLGLFIVKGIVEAHGGHVWVESKVGEGTTFFVTLPVEKTP